MGAEIFSDEKGIYLIDAASDSDVRICGTLIVGRAKELKYAKSQRD
jgi:hypothetical protein